MLGGIVSGTILDASIEVALEKMSDADREHFKVIVAALLACYTDEKMHGILLIGRDETGQERLGDVTELTQMMSINSTDINAAQLVAAAQAATGTFIMQDAPDRTMYN